MAWNRAQRRQMSKFGLGEEEMKKRLNEAWNKAEEATYRTAFAAMILALYQAYHFPNTERRKHYLILYVGRISHERRQYDTCLFEPCGTMGTASYEWTRFCPSAPNSHRKNKPEMYHSDTYGQTRWFMLGLPK